MTPENLSLALNLSSVDWLSQTNQTNCKSTSVTSLLLMPIFCTCFWLCTEGVLLLYWTHSVCQMCTQDCCSTHCASSSMKMCHSFLNIGKMWVARGQGGWLRYGHVPNLTSYNSFANILYPRCHSHPLETGLLLHQQCSWQIWTSAHGYSLRILILTQQECSNEDLLISGINSSPLAFP